MPQYYRILDNGVPKPKSKKKDDTWSNPDSAKKMMKKYAGDSSDLKNARNVMGKKGINNVFDQLHYMAKSDEATRTAGKGNPYKRKNKKADSVRGENMRKRKRYDDKMGFKPVFVGKPPKKNVKKGAK